MKLEFDGSPQEFLIIQGVLQRALPCNSKVWLFGSRAKHQAKHNSDVDLAIDCKQPLDKATRKKLDEGFDESHLPYHVDVVDMQKVSNSFKTIIDQQKIIFPFNNNVPSLRFSEFSGEWELAEFGEMAEKSSSKFNPQTASNALPCIELDCLSQGTGVLLNSYSSDKQKSIKTKFEKGDVLFGKLRPYLRKYLHPHFEGVCSSEIWVLKGKKVSNSYLYRLVQINKFNSVSNITSGSKMPRADWSYVSVFPFSYPSLSEQQKIAYFLTAVDRRIGQLEKKKRLLTEYKKGVMQQIFPASRHAVLDTASSQPEQWIADQARNDDMNMLKIRFTDDNGNPYPDWQEKRLGDVASFFSGGTPITTNKNFYDGDIPFIKSGEINALKTKQYLSEAGVDGSSAKLVEVGDLLYALYGATSGEVGISKIKGAINQALLCIRSQQNISCLYNFLRFNKVRILNKYLQGGQGNLSANIIKKLTVPLPSIEEQQKIADFLTSIDNKIEQVGSQLQLAKTFKKGLLQQMFV